MARSVRYAFVALAFWVGSAVTAAPSALELRLVHGRESVYLALPEETSRNRKAIEQMEVDGWEALAPLTRALRAQPASDTFLVELRRWGKTQGRVLTVSEMIQGGDVGRDVLDYARVQYRGDRQTAEQADVWVRAELPPGAEALTLHMSLKSYAMDDGVEDVEFDFDWRSAPVVGEDAVARGKHWASDGAAPFHSELRTAIVALIDLFEAGRHDALPVAGPLRGQAVGSAKRLGLVRVDGERVLLIDDDDKYFVVPSAEWTVKP
jgi:hypothetical protein